MQSLKKGSIIQKLKSIFIKNQKKSMQNIFGNIQLIRVESNDLLQPDLSGKKQVALQPTPKKDSRPSVYRPTIDYQESKKKSQGMRQVQQIRKNMRTLKQKNQQLYSKIITLNSQFAYVLFQPKNLQNALRFASIQDIRIYQQKLMKELDKLYEQNCMLEKEINRVRFVEQAEQKQKQQKLGKQIDHYKFLRTIWQPNNNLRNSQKVFSTSDQEENKCDDFIQKLNKKVAMIRYSINGMLREQKNLGENRGPTMQKIQDEFVLKSKRYQQLFRMYERKCMEAQDQNNYERQRLKVRSDDLEIQVYKQKIRQMEQREFESQKRIEYLQQQLKKASSRQINERSCKKQGQLIENFNLQLSELSRHKSISKRCLEEVDINKLKTDRLSLIKKTTKLTQTLQIANKSEKKIRKDERIERLINSVRQKENEIIFDDRNKDLNKTIELNIFEDIQNANVFLQLNDNRAKFVRTAQKTRREGIMR